MKQPKQSPKESSPSHKAEVINFAKYIPKDRAATVDRKGWVNYGRDNDVPQYLLGLYRASADHHALCTGIAFMIAGKGVNAPLFSSDTIENMALDLKVQGGFYVEVILSLDKQSIAKVNHLPFEAMRVAETDDNNEISGAWYSSDWMDVRKNKPVYIQRYTPDVLTKVPIEERLPRYVYFDFIMTPGTQYYPDPDYIGALEYIELDKAIGEYHNSNLANGLFPSIVIDYFNGDPGPEGRDEIRRQFNNIQGSKNSGRYVINLNDAGSQAPQYNAFPITDADKQYQFLSELATNKIMRGHRVISPLLFGIRDGSGLGSNKDELTVATYLFTLQVIKPFQRYIEKAIEAISGVSIAIEPNVPTFDTPTPAPAPTPVQQAKFSAVEMSDDDSAFWLSKLSECGEVIDTEEWELVHEEEVTNSKEESRYHTNQLPAKLHALKFFSEYATPEERSEWGDSGLYKLRYKYAGGVRANTRPFCRQMMSDSDSGTVYRYEDIAFMSFSNVNGDFAPKGSSGYDIFTWKGGVYCHHFWKRQIYFRKRKGGKFLPNDGLNNDKLVGNVPFVPQKGDEGTRPIDTPTRGKLN